MVHTCHAHGCTVAIPPKYFMCPRHWRMVPAALQAAVWATYRPGQEVDKEPTVAYLEATAAAKEAVKEHEEQRRLFRWMAHVGKQEV